MFHYTTITNPKLSNWPLRPERKNKPFNEQEQKSVQDDLKSDLNNEKDKKDKKELKS